MVLVTGAALVLTVVALEVVVVFAVVLVVLVVAVVVLVVLVLVDVDVGNGVVKIWLKAFSMVLLSSGEAYLFTIWTDDSGMDSVDLAPKVDSNLDM